jgi:hypothetical protein
MAGSVAGRAERHERTSSLRPAELGRSGGYRRYRYQRRISRALSWASCRIASATTSRACGVGAARSSSAFLQASSRQAKMSRSAVAGTGSENRPGHNTCWISGYTTGRVRTSTSSTCLWSG